MNPRDMHFYEPSDGHGLAHSPLNSIIAPRPIGWISSQSMDGVLNLAPYSFFNLFSYDPPIIGFSAVTPGETVKDTVANARSHGEFCWNLVSRDLAAAMNETSAAVPQADDEFVLAGLTPAASRIVETPHVLQAGAVFECRTSQVLALTTASGASTSATLVLAEVVGVHIASSLIKDGIYQTTAGQPVLRGGGPSTYFTIEDDLSFQMSRPGTGVAE